MIIDQFKCRSYREYMDDVMGCYIMTLGVIDECRKLGIGTMLLEETYRQVRYFYPECNLIYLHVVDYNKSAIKFYINKNNFIEMGREENHYEIFNKEYDALILYREIDPDGRDEIYD